MADTKISALTAATAAADANELAINEAGSSKKPTALQLKTYANTAPVFAAGTASANTHPKFTSGALLTTPEAGAIEYVDELVYITPQGANRGVTAVEYWILQASNRSLTNSTAEQNIFNSVTGGTLNLPTGRYLFEMLIGVTGMNAASGNLALDLLGGGSAVFGTTMYSNHGIDQGTVTSSGTQTGSLSTAAQGNASVLTAGTGATVWVRSLGIFTITTAGTIIPSLTLVTANAATLLGGSHFSCHRIGTASQVSAGDWT